MRFPRRRLLSDLRRLATDHRSPITTLVSPRDVAKLYVLNSYFLIFFPLLTGKSFAVR
jgi:hypothetical protein